MRLLAGCMAGREARLSRALQGYRTDPANAATLRAWFKVDPLPRELGVQDLALAPEMSTDQLCAVRLPVDRRLGEFVERVAEVASLPRIKELFADLAAQEEAEQRQMARATWRSSASCRELARSTPYGGAELTRGHVSAVRCTSLERERDPS